MGKGEALKNVHYWCIQNMRELEDWPGAIEFSVTKRREVLAKRGVDLLRAARIFEGDVVTSEDDRGDYGEKREVSVGLVDGECFVVVHTRRGDAIRLITAWKGGKRDRHRYQAGIACGDPADAGGG